MCGISGLWRAGGLLERDHAALRAMNAAIAHRGPDGAGFWFDDAAGIALAQRRLAIIDVSPTGAQPMHSASGRYTITFNGEIYDYAALRAELEARGKAPAWHGTSDTEILLAGIEADGIEAALRRIRGMFAFALYDREQRRLVLARDAFGEKPLYVGRADGAVLFASELKALTAYPAWRGTIRRAALTAAIRQGYVPAPLTLYNEAEKLRPGEMAAIDCASGSDLPPRRVAFWDSLAIATEARSARFAGSAAMAEAELDRLLHAAIRRQMVADVPVGAFLSGGIDSSTIAAIMQAERTLPIETFSLGFKEAEFDESPHARAVAKHLRTAHNEIILTGQDAADLVLAMPRVYDEPFADPSQLPTYLVAGFARRKVTVALSGDAGDELFAGYGRYHSLRRRWERPLTGRLLRLATTAYANALIRLGVEPARALGFVQLAGHRLEPLALRLADLAARSSSSDAISAYARGHSVIDAAHLLVKGGESAADPLIDAIRRQGWSILEQASFHDAERYLTDDILVKVDRAAMAHGLETRVPMLDPDIVRFAWSLPDPIRVLNGERKGLLKAVLGRYVPRALWDRPKQGFGIPVAQWLKGPFRALAADLFAREAIARQNLLETDLVVAIWEDFLAGGQRRTNLVWTLFILLLVLDREGESRS